MKSTIYLVLSGFLILLSACVEEQFIEETVDDLNIQEQGFTYSMQFDAPYPHYNGEDETRATSTGEWEDGDIVYFLFYGQSKSEKGLPAQGIYHQDTKEWTIQSDFSLTEIGDARCEVWFVNGHRLDCNNHIKKEYDYLTSAYLDKDGRYSVHGETIVITAVLKPNNSRIRFKGEVGTKISVYGNYDLDFLSGFYLHDLETINRESCELVVNEDGYTDYCVIKVSDRCSRLYLENAFNYWRYFYSDILKEGESGCFSIPSYSNNHNWTSDVIDDYVDLGLPSGLKWATRNIGATTPEEYGDYFAWGETEPKTTYDWSNYKWCNGSNNTMTKYCTSSSDGTVDNKTTLELEDDAAHVNWGGAWRMPTRAEQDELINICTWTWTTQNGVEGYKVMGPNGNSIFLPAAGLRNYGDLGGATSNGGFWSSSLDTSNSRYACYLLFYSGSFGWDGLRFYGQSVRPVCQ